MDLPIAYVGDDFTGSVEVTEALHWTGVRTVLFLDLPTEAQLREFAGVQAIGVATDNRYLTPEEMDHHLRAMLNGLAALSPKFLHYKTCATGASSPRSGSIGKAIEIGREICGCSKVPVLIAAPDQQSYQVFGNLFASSGEPSKLYRLDRHPTMRYHPLTPMYEADLRAHIKLQTNLPVELVDCRQLEEAAQTQWGSAGDIVLFDTLTQAHVAAFGRFCHAQAQAVKTQFVVGSAAVEEAIVNTWQENHQRPAWLAPAGSIARPASSHLQPVDQLLVLTASHLPTNERQAMWAKQAGFESLEIQTALLVDLETQAAEKQRVIEQACAALAAKRNLIMHTVLGPSDRRRNQLMNVYAKMGLSQEQIQIENPKRLGPVLGEVIQQILAAQPVPRLGITGGDTSSQVLRMLGAKAVEVIASVEDSAPLCRIHSENALNGLEVILKSGASGHEHFWKRALGQVNHGVPA